MKAVLSRGWVVFLPGFVGEAGLGTSGCPGAGASASLEHLFGIARRAGVAMKTEFKKAPPFTLARVENGEGGPVGWDQRSAGPPRGL